MPKTVSCLRGLFTTGDVMLDVIMIVGCVLDFFRGRRFARVGFDCYVVLKL